MKEFYIFDGEEFIECADMLKEDLINLCEDNEIIKESINHYFKDKN